MSTYSVIICPHEKLDPYRTFILSNWKRSLRSGNDYFKEVHAPAYFAAYERLTHFILNQDLCTVRLAVLTDDMDVALGFSVCRGTILDYVWVKANQRHCGVGKHLIPPGITTISHMTRTAFAIRKKEPYSSWKFNPFE